jgi:hypothetical protein
MEPMIGSEDQMLESLSAIKGAIAPEFWQHWEISWNTHFKFLYSFFQERKKTGVEESDTTFLVISLKQLERYILIRLSKDRTLIAPQVYTLINHVIRNDLHLFFWISEIVDYYAKPIPPDKVLMLIDRLDHMRNFWDKLKDITKGK